MQKCSKTILLLFLTLFFISSCATVPQIDSKEPTIDPSTGTSSVQEDLIDSARWALGKKTLVVDGRKFNMDCSGVVMAVYYKSGIDLLSPLNQYSGGGVQRLYGFMDDSHLLYKQPHLAPGDILFWDNTYDSNDDGKINDPLTHIGMVVSSDSQGNVQYIHHNYRKGIVLAKMNLLDPDNVKMNSPMRARYAEKGHAPLWLSSHLLNQAAKGYLLTEN